MKKMKNITKESDDEEEIDRPILKSYARRPSVNRIQWNYQEIDNWVFCLISPQTTDST